MATTNIDSALPDVDLGPGSQIWVDTGDASALISLLNVYTSSPVPGEEFTPEPFVPLFVYGSEA